MTAIAAILVLALLVLLLASAWLGSRQPCDCTASYRIDRVTGILLALAAVCVPAFLLWVAVGSGT